jgi:hypothetical protein
MDSPGALEVLLAIFDGLGIEYMVGGSLASSMAGVWRATQDIDLVARASRSNWTAGIGTDPRVLRGRRRHARRHRKGGAFNVIHYGSSQKFDIFPVLDDPYYEVEF